MVRGIDILAEAVSLNPPELGLLMRARDAELAIAETSLAQNSDAPAT